MKKRICAVLLVLSLILSFALLAGFEKDDSPEFVKIEDGDKTISVTENDLDGLEYASYSREKDGEVTYYRGYKLKDILEKKKINLSSIESITFTAADDYSRDLEGENLDTCILAVQKSDSEDSGYADLTKEDGGPIIAYSTAEDTSFKNVKELVKIKINRA